jgi:antitoxin VapB
VETVALNIKDPETDRLARELATATGESITVATRRAIEERLERVRASAPTGRRDEIDAIIHRGRTRPRLDQRTDAEIRGFGSDGLPA